MHLIDLFVHPLKSARGIRHTTALATLSGLVSDRRWMLAHPDGQFVTARELPQLTQIRVTVLSGAILLSAAGHPPIAAIETAYTQPCATSVWGDAFSAWHGDAAVDAWCSRVLGCSVQLLYAGDTPNRRQKTLDAPLGFADGYPYLLVGQGSLDTLNARLAQPVTARHFRPNLVVADTQPYEEDDWTVIQIGEVVFDVVKPCTRCILTTVNPATGIAAADGEPMTTLMRDRLFDDGVHFGQNLVPRNTGTLAVGMPVTVLATRLAF